MKIVNNNIYISRGETPTYEADIIDVDTGAPYIILEKVLNPTIDFVVRPSVYSRAEDSVFRAFILLTNVHKFETAEIADYEHEGVWNDDYTPLEANRKKLHRRTIATGKGKTYEYAYYEDGKWHEYKLRLTFMFPHYITKVMEPKTYQYEIVLLGGNYKADFGGKDISNDLDRELGTAYSEIPIDVTYDKPLLDAHDFVVGGSMSE